MYESKDKIIHSKPLIYYSVNKNSKSWNIYVAIKDADPKRRNEKNTNRFRKDKLLAPGG